MIVMELMGGMGNQMFQYALGRHLAIKNNCNLYLDTAFLLDRTGSRNQLFRDFDLGIFNVNYSPASSYISFSFGSGKQNVFKIVLKNIFKNRALYYHKESSFEFDPDILLFKKSVYLSGYWQNEKYFREIGDVIRADFSFKYPISEKSILLLSQIRSRNSVCLNVRRTDFTANPNLGALTAEYFLRAEEIIKKSVSDPFIYVFSDDLEWCKENLNLSVGHFFVEHDFAGDKFRDYLELMINCKHFIIPNSSFAWWAAWLSTNKEKIVIAPRNWVSNPVWNEQLSDVTPSDWIRL